MNTLLKKYRLVSIPKIPDGNHSPSPVSSRQVSHHRRRQTVKKIESKTKQIVKAPLKTDSYFYLLARKINSFLKHKEGL